MFTNTKLHIKVTMIASVLSVVLSLEKGSYHKDLHLVFCHIK